MQQQSLMDVARRDERYALEAYEFLFEALGHSQKLSGKATAGESETEPTAEHHVNGAELLSGLCDLAKREFGRMARIVFRQWGIERTDDWGEIVFNLIEANLLSKTESDNRTDFRDLFDLDDVLLTSYQIELEPAE